MTTIQEIQEIMDWCDNLCWRFPWASEIFVARAKERIADLRAEEQFRAKDGAPNRREQ